MTTNATRQPRTTRLIENGHTICAGGGAVNQDGPLPIYVCNTCGGQVVWATSARTGRKYLVSVSRKMNGARFYIKTNVHPSDCGTRREAELAEVREWTARLEAERLAARPTVEKLEYRYERMFRMLAARPWVPAGHRWALITHFVCEAIEDLDGIEAAQ